MTGLVWIGADLVVVALVFGAGLWLGRRSNVERAVDRVLDKQTRLSAVRDSLAADQGGED